jgi:hypothetical protein
MAKMQVRVTDKVNPKNAGLDAVCFKAGYVISVVEDDHQFSPNETVGDYRIVECPGVPKSKLEQIYIQPPDDEVVVGPRAVKVDLAAFNSLGKEQISEAEAISISAPVTKK